MMALVDRALALNPNYARGWHTSGILRLFAGQPDLAIEHYEATLRLSPRARVGTTLANIGVAHFVSRRFDQAVPKLLLAIQEGTELHAALSLPRRLLRSYGSARRRPRNRRAAAGYYLSRDAQDASYLRNAEHRHSSPRVCAWRPAKGHDGHPVSPAILAADFHSLPVRAAMT